MSTERLISIEIVAVDRQNNSNYCAWSFRVGFCHCSLCWGRPPNTEGTSIRDHLQQCLENVVIQPFLSEMLKRRRAHSDMKNDKIEVFCTCRSTEDNSMLECVKCSTVYVHEEVQ